MLKQHRNKQSKRKEKNIKRRKKYFPSGNLFRTYRHLYILLFLSFSERRRNFKKISVLGQNKTGVKSPRMTTEENLKQKSLTTKCGV